PRSRWARSKARARSSSRRRSSGSRRRSCSRSIARSGGSPSKRSSSAVRKESSSWIQLSPPAAAARRRRLLPGLPSGCTRFSVRARRSRRAARCCEGRRKWSEEKTVRVTRSSTTSWLRRRRWALSTQKAASRGSAQSPPRRSISATAARTNTRLAKPARRQGPSEDAKTKWRVQTSCTSCSRRPESSDSSTARLRSASRPMTSWGGEFSRRDMAVLGSTPVALAVDHSPMTGRNPQDSLPARLERMASLLLSGRGAQLASIERSFPSIALRPQDRAVLEWLGSRKLPRTEPEPWAEALCERPAAASAEVEAAVQRALARGLVRASELRDGKGAFVEGEPAGHFLLQAGLAEEA